MCNLGRGNKNREGARRGGVRRHRKKRGRGMKDRVDKSRGIVTLIVEALATIKRTGTSRSDKQAGLFFFLSRT